MCGEQRALETRQLARARPADVSRRSGSGHPKNRWNDTAAKTGNPSNRNGEIYE
ncbi:MAG: hypothetical protein HFG92_17130 [Dorea sp.]|nr:hypothetical protein [Dorea sp.]